MTPLRQEILDIQANAKGHADLREDHHEKLFNVYRQIDSVLGDCAGTDEEDDEKAPGLIEAQTVVIRTACALPARSLRDLLYKLALWRWDAPELDQPVEKMNRSDAIAYSAFRDLAKMLNETLVLKDFDKAS